MNLFWGQFDSLHTNKHFGLVSFLPTLISPTLISPNNLCLGVALTQLVERKVSFAMPNTHCILSQLIQTIHMQCLNTQSQAAIEALKVVSLVAPVKEGDILKKFPGLFKGLGKLKDNCD